MCIFDNDGECVAYRIPCPINEKCNAKDKNGNIKFMSIEKVLGEFYKSNKAIHLTENDETVFIK